MNKIFSLRRVCAFASEFNFMKHIGVYTLLGTGIRKTTFERQTDRKMILRFNPISEKHIE